MKTTTRQRDESLPQLFQTIRRLSHQVSPVQRPHFIDVLNKADIPLKIHQSHSKTFTDALTRGNV